MRAASYTTAALDRMTPDEDRRLALAAEAIERRCPETVAELVRSVELVTDGLRAICEWSAREKAEGK